MASAQSDPIAVARAAWPGVDVPDEAFRTYLADRAEPGASQAISDLYLA